MAQGKVKQFDDQKGFGIIADEAGKEYTFNQSALEAADLKALAQGDAVSFDVETGARGLRAVRVKKL